MIAKLAINCTPVRRLPVLWSGSSAGAWLLRHLVVPGRELLEWLGTGGCQLGGLVPEGGCLVAELVDLHAEFGDEFVVAGLLVGQPLCAVGALSFGLVLGGGELGAQAGECGAMLGGLGLPVLELPAGSGQLLGEVLKLGSGPGGLLPSELGPVTLLLNPVPLGRELLGELGPGSRQVGALLPGGGQLLAELIDLCPSGGQLVEGGG